MSEFRRSRNRKSRRQAFTGREYPRPPYSVQHRGRPDNDPIFERGWFRDQDGTLREAYDQTTDLLRADPPGTTIREMLIPLLRYRPETIADMARRIGLTSSHLSRIASGTASFSLDVLEKLMQLLDLQFFQNDTPLPGDVPWRPFNPHVRAAAREIPLVAQECPDPDSSPEDDSEDDESVGRFQVKAVATGDLNENGVFVPKTYMEL